MKTLSITALIISITLGVWAGLDGIEDCCCCCQLYPFPLFPKFLNGLIFGANTLGVVWALLILPFTALIGWRCSIKYSYRQSRGLLLLVGAIVAFIIFGVFYWQPQDDGFLYPIPYGVSLAFIAEIAFRTRKLRTAWELALIAIILILIYVNAIAGPLLVSFFQYGGC